MNGKFAVTGWVVAAVLAGVMFAGGFQGAQDKFGVVDLNKAVQDSDVGKKNKEQLESAVNARRGIIDFMNLNRVLTVEQAQKLKNLSLKSPPTDAEKKDLDKVKADVVQAKNNFEALNQKASPTEDDRNLLKEYNNRIQSTDGLIQNWGGEFQGYLENLQQTLISDSVKRADTAIREIAKKDGYTVVYAMPASAVYGANDLTGALTKAIDAQK